MLYLKETNYVKQSNTNDVKNLFVSALSMFVVP